VRAELRRVVPHLDHDGDRAEPAEDPADPDRVGDRLAQAVRLRHLEVGERGLVPADLDLVDQVVGAVEGRAPVGERGDGVPRAGLLDQPRRRAFGGREPLRVDVVERDLEGPVELLV
jgi:hypothetical protein